MTVKKLWRIPAGAAAAAAGLAGFICFKNTVLNEAIGNTVKDNGVAVALGSVPAVVGGALLLLLMLSGIALLACAAFPEIKIRNMIPWLGCAAVAACCLYGSLTILGSRMQSADSAPAAEQTAAPAAEAQAETANGLFSSFTATGFSGDAVDQSILAGKKMTVINCWATFCGPCIKEMPVLNQLAAEYADRGVQVIGICSDVLDEDSMTVDDDAFDEAKDIVEKTGAEYPQLIPSAGLKTGALSDIQSFPVTFFVDEHGNVLRMKKGATEEKGWKELFDEVLAEL